MCQRRGIYRKRNPPTGRWDTRRSNVSHQSIQTLTRYYDGLVRSGATNRDDILVRYFVDVFRAFRYNPIAFTRTLNTVRCNLYLRIDVWNAGVVFYRVPSAFRMEKIRYYYTLTTIFLFKLKGFEVFKAL